MGDSGSDSLAWAIKKTMSMSEQDGETKEKAQDRIPSDKDESRF